MKKNYRPSTEPQRNAEQAVRNATRRALWIVRNTLAAENRHSERHGNSNVVSLRHWRHVNQRDTPQPPEPDAA